MSYLDGLPSPRRIRVKVRRPWHARPEAYRWSPGDPVIGWRYLSDVYRINR